MTRDDMALQILLAFIREGAVGREIEKRAKTRVDEDVVFADMASGCFALADAMLAAGTPTRDELAATADAALRGALQMEK